jgi:hypothetical protein
MSARPQDQQHSSTQEGKQRVLLTRQSGRFLRGVRMKLAHNWSSNNVTWCDHEPVRASRGRPP